MSHSEKALLHRLKTLGLREGSGDFRDYEIAKRMLREQGLTSDEFENAIRKTTNFLKCEL